MNPKFLKDQKFGITLILLKNTIPFFLKNQRIKVTSLDAVLVSPFGYFTVIA